MISLPAKPLPHQLFAFILLILKPLLESFSKQLTTRIGLRRFFRGNKRVIRDVGEGNEWERRGGGVYALF